MRLSLRIGAILSLMAVVITIPLYVQLETNNFNAYCADERGDLIRSGLADPETWMTAIMWLVITALPCLAARQSLSLKIFAILAAGFAGSCVLCLPFYSGPPIECFTSGGSYPSDSFDLVAPLTAILLSAIFYMVLAFDLAGSWLRKRG
jgi:hypothetical protein